MSKIAYDLQLIQAVVFDIDGVLSPSTIPVGPDGVPQRMANVKDGYALQLAIKKGLKLAIISGAATESSRLRYTILGFQDIYLGIADKESCLRGWMESQHIKPENVAYVGDDIPDIKPMLMVGLPVAPADAAPEVKQVARYITVANGGYGVARELIEQILRAKGLWLSDPGCFSW